MRLLVIFWTTGGLLETIFNRIFKVKNGSRDCPLRYLQNSYRILIRACVSDEIRLPGISC